MRSCCAPVCVNAELAGARGGYQLRGGFSWQGLGRSVGQLVVLSPGGCARGFRGAARTWGWNLKSKIRLMLPAGRESLSAPLVWGRAGEQIRLSVFSRLWLVAIESSVCGQCTAKCTGMSQQAVQRRWRGPWVAFAA